MKKDFDKAPLSFEAQLELLKSRGMSFDDFPDKLNYLRSVGYYRLSSYWYPFRNVNKGVKNEEFTAGTSFETVVSLYELDRKLRLLILGAVERIEVGIRSLMNEKLSQEYGAFALYNSQNFHPNFRYVEWLSKLEKEVERSNDTFLKHFDESYKGFPKVPIWMASEVMSLGALSRLFTGMKNVDKSKIAEFFDINHKRLSDWIHSLTYIRNVCAHHSRVWNRELSIRVTKIKDENWQAPITPRNDRIFYILLVLRTLQKNIAYSESWKVDTEQLVKEFCENSSWQKAMGIPDDWQKHPLWK